MQTFLPYPDFWESAKCLDNQRLGKQRVECLQILNALKPETDTWGSRISRGWVNHPATKMWRGYEGALRYYMHCCITVWEHRGFKNSIEKQHIPVVKNPPWIGDKAFHDSHKSNLLRKAPFWYGKFNWNVRDDLPYVWPV